MIPHGAFLQKDTIDIKLSFLYCPSIDRKRGTQYCIWVTKLFHHGIRHRSNVPFLSGIKGRTVFKIQLPGALLKQPPKCPEGISYRLLPVLGSGF